MQVDAKDWMSDLEKQANANSMAIALLKLKVESNHDVVMRNSDHRLEIITDRFDRLEGMVQGRTNKLLAWSGSLFVAFCTAAWFTIVVPLQDDIAILERRMLDAEKYRPIAIAEPE